MKSTNELAFLSNRIMITLTRFYTLDFQMNFYQLINCEFTNDTWLAFAIRQKKLWVQLIKHEHESVIF